MTGSHLMAVSGILISQLSVIILKGISIFLRSRPTRAWVRRVLVRDEIVIDDTQANVPIRWAHVNLHAPPSDWDVNC
jgi:hypothetical protein